MWNLQGRKGFGEMRGYEGPGGYAGREAPGSDRWNARPDCAVPFRWVLCLVLCCAAGSSTTSGQPLPENYKLGEVSITSEITCAVYKPWSNAQLAPNLPTVMYTMPPLVRKDVDRARVDVRRYATKGCLSVEVVLRDHGIAARVARWAEQRLGQRRVEAILYAPTRWQITCPLLDALTGEAQVKTLAVGPADCATVTFLFPAHLAPDLLSAVDQGITFEILFEYEGYESLDVNIRATQDLVLDALRKVALDSPEGFRFVTVDQRVELMHRVREELKRNVTVKFPRADVQLGAWVDRLLEEELASTQLFRERWIDLDIYLRALLDRAGYDANHPRLNPKRLYRMMRETHTKNEDQWRHDWGDESDWNANGKLGFNLFGIDLGFGGSGGTKSKDSQMRSLYQEIKNHTRYDEEGPLPVTVQAYQVMDANGQVSREVNQWFTELRPVLFSWPHSIRSDRDVWFPTVRLFGR